MKLDEAKPMRFKKGDKENFIIYLSSKFLEAFKKGKNISKSNIFDITLASYVKQGRVANAGWRSHRLQDQITKAAIDIAMRDYKTLKRKK